SSNGESIATSVIVSGGYKDDEDAGNVIVYTRHDGQDKHSRQVVHQKLEGRASGKVYVFDGLYKIVEAWFDVGKSGFGVFKFKLVRMVNQVEMGSAVLKFANTLRARPLEARPVGACSNILVQLALYEHSHYAFPHLMLFAMENIPPLRELSIDYEAAPPNEASPNLAICN
ncbi:histone-lysine N-methyltransferase family member SUVH9-like protein, partial [Tanacetum coccineum]